MENQGKQAFLEEKEKKEGGSCRGKESWAKDQQAVSWTGTALNGADGWTRNRLQLIAKASQKLSAAVQGTANNLQGVQWNVAQVMLSAGNEKLAAGTKQLDT